MLAKSKFNNIESLVSHALIDMEINDEKFLTILRKKRQVWEDERKWE